MTSSDKRRFVSSDSLWTKFGPYPKGFQNMPQTLKSLCKKSFKLFPSAIEQSQFSKDMMERIRSASWRAKIERMSYRHDHQDKTPGLVSFQQLLTTRDLQ